MHRQLGLGILIAIQGLGLTARAERVEGELHVAVIVLDYPSANSCSVEAMERDFFGGHPSVGDFLEETSYGYLRIRGDVFGPYRIPYDGSGSRRAGRETVKHLADARLRAEGIDPDSFDRRVYVAPRLASYEGGIGLSDSGNAWLFGHCDNLLLKAHELGHTLGMAHASTYGRTYGDRSDSMGSGHSPVHFNGPHKYQMGWIDESEVLTVRSTGVFQLRDIERRGAGPSLLRVPIPGGNEAYYVSFRRPVGYDGSLEPSFRNAVQLHRWSRRRVASGDPAVLGESAAATLLIANLRPGQAYRTADLLVKYREHDGMTATVRICRPPSPCGDANAIRRPVGTESLPDPLAVALRPLLNVVTARNVSFINSAIRFLRGRF